MIPFFYFHDNWFYWEENYWDLNILFCFENIRTSRFQICPWFWKLTKICGSNRAKQNIQLFLPVLYIECFFLSSCLIESQETRVFFITCTPKLWIFIVVMILIRFTKYSNSDRVKKLNSWNDMNEQSNNLNDYEIFP